MKNILIITLFALMISCSENGHNHDHDHDHDHSKHGHEEEGHDHDEEGHDHDEEGHNHGAEKTGEGKAIKSIGEKGEIEISDEAINQLNIKFQSISSSNIKTVKESLVFDKEDIGFYLYRHGKFIFQKIKSFEKIDDKFVRFTSPSYRPGDQIVISEVGVVKLADIFAHDESEYGHSH